ncbi:FtsK/SpoIIIE domain-containing protein [Microbacterium laevaniformans]|uniref:FtsK/SpoIIIE domain-containing protein n=1 Tax=Microbacterium laevaniformans TaxID=36807 RepID=UPI003D971C4C
MLSTIVALVAYAVALGLLVCVRGGHDREYASSQIMAERAADAAATWRDAAKGARQVRRVAKPARRAKRSAFEAIMVALGKVLWALVWVPAVFFLKALGRWARRHLALAASIVVPFTVIWMLAAAPWSALEGTLVLLAAAGVGILLSVLSIIAGLFAGRAIPARRGAFVHRGVRTEPTVLPVREVIAAWRRELPPRLWPFAVFAVLPAGVAIPIGDLTLPVASLACVALYVVAARFSAAAVSKPIVDRWDLQRKKEGLEGQIAEMVGVPAPMVAIDAETFCLIPGQMSVRAGIPLAGYRRVAGDLDGALVKAGLGHLQGTAEAVASLPGVEDGGPVLNANAHGGADHWLILQDVSRDTLRRRDLLASSGGLVAGVSAPDRDGRCTVTLAPGTSPTRAEDVAAWAGRELSVDLVEWDPRNNRAILARLSVEERSLRDGYAARISGAKPHDVNVRATRGPDGNRTIVVESLKLREVSSDARQNVAEELRNATTESTRHWQIVTDSVTGTITLVEQEDPLAAIVPYTDDPSRPVDVTAPWRVGVDDHGNDVLVELATGAHILIGGATRSGKSVATYSLITHVARMGDSARVLVADPNDTTIAPFENIVSWSTSDTHPGKVTSMLHWARGEMDRRKPLLRQMQTDKVDADQFGPDLPLIVLIIDEAANYTTHHDKAAAALFRSELADVVAQGAKYGVRLVFITQRPDATVVDTKARAQFSARILFRVEDKETALMVFPDLEEPKILLGLPKGVGMYRGVAEQARFIRAAYLSDHWGAAARIRTEMPRIIVPDWEPEGDSPRPRRGSVKPSPSLVKGRIAESGAGEDEVVDVGLVDIDFAGMFDELSPANDPWSAAAARAQAVDGAAAVDGDDLFTPLGTTAPNRRTHVDEGFGASAAVVPEEDRL